MEYTTLKIISLTILSLIIITWTISTYYVENMGSDLDLKFEVANSEKGSAIIMLDPDPIYDFDKKICIAIAEGFNALDMSANVVSASKIKNQDLTSFDYIVICANTYNFAPDRIIKNLVKTRKDLSGKNVVAVTLGAGSTQRSQELLEGLIKKAGAQLLVSEAYWLLKPNDESIKDLTNEEIAINSARMIPKDLLTKQSTTSHLN